MGELPLMKKTAAILSLIVSLILLWDSSTDYIDSQKHAANNLKSGFDKISAGEYASLDRDLDRQTETQHTQSIEAIVGAGFLVAAFALWKFDRDTEDDSEESPSNGLSIISRN